MKTKFEQTKSYEIIDNKKEIILVKMEDSLLSESTNFILNLKDISDIYKIKYYKDITNVINKLSFDILDSEFMYINHPNRSCGYQYYSISDKNKLSKLSKFYLNYINKQNYYLSSFIKDNKINDLNVSEINLENIYYLNSNHMHIFKYGEDFPINFPIKCSVRFLTNYVNKEMCVVDSGWGKEFKEYLNKLKERNYEFLSVKGTKVVLNFTDDQFKKLWKCRSKKDLMEKNYSLLYEMINCLFYDSNKDRLIIFDYNLSDKTDIFKLLKT